MTRLLIMFLISTGVTYNSISQANTFSVGTKIEIDYYGKWYPGSILEVKGNQYKVHYDGYGANWDTWLTKDKLRLIGTSTKNGSVNSTSTNTKPTQSNETRYQGKKRVEVNDRAYWYKASVLEQKGDMFKVHFDGYSDADDKWVHKAYVRDLNKDEKPITVTCSFTPPPGDFNNSSAASTALFKKEIYDYYNRIVNGTLSRPTRIGIVFTSFVPGSAYKNTVTNVPGRGATRKHEGAPVNATIYPAKTTFFVCEEYKDGTTQKQVNSDFSFFINKEGEWTCSKDN